MASRLRKRVGNYYIGRTLGEGTYAKVMYGQHAETGEAVAVKVLDKAVLAEKGMEANLKREIRILTRLRHPHIVALKEVMASKDSVFLVMELVPGGELFDRILLDGPLPEPKARRLFAQLLDGVEYCHRHRIYHRDLKPENVLLTADGGAKLSDFGLGALPAAAEGAAMLSTTCGTPNYVAPEVLAGGAYAGSPADVWSLGVLLYVVSSGGLPFDESSLPALFQRISRAQYRKPPWFSQQLLAFLGRMLQPDPAQRATIAELRSHPWMCGEAPPQTLPLAALDDDSSAGDESATGDIFQPTVEPQRLTQEEVAAAAGEKRMAGGGGRSVAPPTGMNAFELMNSALDLSALFERCEDVVARATRFTSKAPAPEILGALEAAVRRMGGAARRKDACRTKLSAQQGSGLAAAHVELLPVVPGVQMVEFVRASGSALAFHQLFVALLEQCSAIVADDRGVGLALRSHSGCSASPGPG